VQRLRQADPSWLRRGQTTTLFSSLTEKEPVKGARGGMASIGQSILGAERGASAASTVSDWPSMAAAKLGNALEKLCGSSRNGINTFWGSRSRL
jgi:hypothetical protein